MKLAALLVVIAALGLPLNDLPRFALLVVAAVLVFAGTVTTSRARWLGALAVAGLCLLAQIMLPVPRIEEGHNVFVVKGPGGALEAGLPPAVFRIMADEFDARYPPDRRCDPAIFGCWRGMGLPDRTFAFSADGIFGHPAYSRRVTGIDFSDPVWLRLGFINEVRYNWNSRTSDVERATRDRRISAQLHQWRLEMPWFVMYRFPAAFAGSALCWRGEVLWEDSGGEFATLRHPTMACRTLTPGDIGRRIFGVAIRNDPPLAMRLDPTAAVRSWQIAAAAVPLIGAAAVVWLLAVWRLRRTLLPFTFIALTLVVAFLNDPSFIGGVRPFDSGDDGLVYDGYARGMLRHLMAGDIRGALRGEESVFYFTPGTRYLRAFGHVIFGESYLGYVALMMFLPILVFALFRRFLPSRWALALALTFTAIPVGVLFGSSLVLYIKWAARGFGDPAAYVSFLAGLFLLIGHRGTEPHDRGPQDRFAPACGAGALFALALFVRPNLAPAAGILLGGAGLAALWQLQVRRLAGMCVGFLPVFGMALHNWVYGGVFVLFTTTSALAQSMPPSAYVAAFAELLRLDFTGEHVTQMLRQLGDWLAGPSEFIVMAPLHLAAIAVLVRVAGWGRSDPWLRLIAGATLAQHCVNLFFLTYARYYYLTWLLTLLVVAVWLHDEGIAVLRHRCPSIADMMSRMARSRAGIAWTAVLDRLLRSWDDGAKPDARHAAT